MKKTFLSLLFILFIGGMYAQMPIILESDLQKKKAEAVANKSQSERGGFRNRTQTNDQEEETEATTQDETQQTQSDVATELSKLGTNSKVTTTDKKNTDVSSETTTTKAKSSSVNRFRERQKKLKK